MTGAPVLGRDAELAAIDRFLEAAAVAPAGLMLEGDAGIGKTTLLTAASALARERGRGVLSCQGDAAEARMAYTALADLLAELDSSSIEQLPAPQREALDAALLRARPPDGFSPDRRAVATGFVSLLERLAREAPVVVAIDDLQWLDLSSAQTIRFAARRVTGAIGLLAAQRPDGGLGAGDRLALRDPERMRRLRLQPLASGHVQRLVVERTGRTLSRPVLERIARTAGGNPFVALELARALDVEGHAGPANLPESLRELVDARLAGLEPRVLEALLLAAALAQPRIAWVKRALGEAPVADLLGQAEAAGVVEVELDRVRFTHPLLATGVYAAASGSARKEAHRLLAGVVDDPEQRARHLGLAGVETDPETLAALEAGAAAARARGAPADAAELLELALNLGDRDPARMVRAAEHRFAAGDSAGARTLLERAIGMLPVGSRRARAIALLGTIRTRDDSYVEGAALLEQALGESRRGAERVAVTLELAYVLANVGRNRDASATVAAAVADATAVGEPGLLAEALAVTTIVRFLAGHGLDRPALERALELEDPDRHTFFQSRPSVIAAILLLWVGELEEAQRTFDAVIATCIERGEESELVYASRHTAGLACARGDLKRADRIVADGLERAFQLDSRMARALALSDQATVRAWTGRVDEARRAAEASLALFEEIGSFAGAQMPIETLGALELSLGDPEAAARWLAEPSVAAVSVVGDPAVVPFVADAVEALVSVGRLEDAQPLVEWHEARAASLARPALVALAWRCRGLVVAARGDAPAAEQALRRALAAHDRFPIAFERARTLLVLGRLQRRQRARRAARATLDEARAAFERLGAALWVARADAEIERLGLRRGAGAALTPSEQRIAELASTGLTNRAVAAALFVSPKTVEASLTRAYRKLGITSRAELGRHMAIKGERREPGIS